MKPIPPPIGNYLKVDELSSEVPALGKKGLISTLLPTDQAEVQLNMAIVMVDQPDTAAKDGSTFNGVVAYLVAQMPVSIRSASLSSGESYYPDIVRTLRVCGRSMSPSDKLAVFFFIMRNDSRLFKEEQRICFSFGSSVSRLRR